ncbi:hypothetical protein GCM10023238_38220 [Streptomyces heliomycini]
MLLEPSDGQVEGGCQGTLRVLLKTTGERAPLRAELDGRNAIHAAAPILARLAAYEPRYPVIDGLEYREGLNAVGVTGEWPATSVHDACVVSVNFRYAPDRSEEEALAHAPRGVRGLRGERVRRRRPQRRGAARLSHPAAAAFIEAVGGTPPQPKYGDGRLPLSYAASRRSTTVRKPPLAAQADERVDTAKISRRRNG